MHATDAKKAIALILPTALLALASCSNTQTPPAELKKTATDCMQNQDYECAESNW